LKRYEDFQVPLLHLRNGQLVKSLRAAGVRIYASPEQAKALQGISDLVEVVETERSTVETKVVYENLEGLIERLGVEVGADEDGEFGLEDAPAQAKPPRKPRRTKKMMELEAQEKEAMKALVEELVPEDEPEDEGLVAERKDAERKLADAKALAQLMGKFVNLKDLLPPLPQKGSFQVTAIKDSPYFFS
jgi:DNA-directed RNA polymerase